MSSSYLQHKYMWFEFGNAVQNNMEVDTQECKYLEVFLNLLFHDVR